MSNKQINKQKKIEAQETVVIGAQECCRSPDWFHRFCSSTFLIGDQFFMFIVHRALCEHV